MRRRPLLLFGELILAYGTPAALAVKAGAPAIPMVFNVGGDPMALGLVASPARPGGNASGLTQCSYQTGIRLYSLLRELVPQARRHRRSPPRYA